MKSILKKHKIFVFLAVLTAITAIYFFYGKKTEKTPEFIVAMRKTVIQEVSVTGRVKPASSVDLAFEKSGKILRTNSDINNHVKVGDVLASLEHADILAELSQAEANLEAEAIKLAELKKGTRQEEIAISRAKSSSAETALIDAKNNLTDKINDAYTKSDDAVRNKIDRFFDNPLSQEPRLSSALNADTSLEQKVEGARLSIEAVLKTWKTSAAKQNLDEIALFLDLAASVVNSASSNANLTQATLDGWRADTATGRTNVNAAISNLSSAEEKLRAAESNLLVVKRELELKESGATSEEIAAEEAKMKSLKAVVDKKRAQLAKTLIISPIDGVVTKMEARVGEIVSANTVLISIISSARLGIEADVPEADIAKLKIGNDADVTLDAYGNDLKFKVKLISIDPAGTLVEGVATYKTKFAFLSDDERAKPEMTADITIFADKRDNVIAIPARAVVNKESAKFVKILTKNESSEEREVKTGLRGSDGNIEILSGISESDKVMISPN